MGLLSVRRFDDSRHTDDWCQGGLDTFWDEQRITYPLQLDMGSGHRLIDSDGRVKPLP